MSINNPLTSQEKQIIIQNKTRFKKILTMFFYFSKKSQKLNKNIKIFVLYSQFFDKFCKNDFSL